MIIPTGARLSGFTLIELVIVLVLLAILSAFVVSGTMPRAGQSTIGYQAQQLASDLRHTQMLAMTWGKGLTFSVASPPCPTTSTYCVSCAAGFSGGPCATSPVVDPGHSGPFKVALDNVTVTPSVNQLTFDIVGKPSMAGTFRLAADGVTMTVSVASGTGFVTVQ